MNKDKTIPLENLAFLLIVLFFLHQIGVFDYIWSKRPLSWKLTQAIIQKYKLLSSPVPQKPVCQELKTDFAKFVQKYQKTNNKTNCLNI